MRVHIWFVAWIPWIDLEFRKREDLDVHSK